MSNLKLRKVLLWLLSLSLSLSLLMFVVSIIVINYEVNQFWGEHTEEVDNQWYEQRQQNLAIVNVNALSTDGENMLAQQTVLIEQGIITHIGSQISLPDDFHVINGTGKFLIPGLIDSHVHLWQSPNDLLLYLANGVTHIRELNGSEEHLQWKAEIQAGRPGPDMFVASRRHNSQGLLKGWFDRWTAKINNVSDVDAVESGMITIMAKGYDAIKIYTFLENNHFKVFNEVAKKLDVQLLGHIPINMKLKEIWQSEMKELAHTEELVKALDREFGGYESKTAKEFLQFVQQRSNEIISHLLDQDMAVISTLALMERFPAQKSHVAEELRTVELAYVNPGIAEATYPAIRVMGWLPDVNIYRLPEDYPSERVTGNLIYWKTYARANQMLIQVMAEAGVRVLAGTDANVPIMVPGFSLHEELQSFAQAGMTESQALLSATSLPAEWMGVKSGKVQAGYQADLLLLRANPLNDIKHTQSIDTVINNGRLYEREQLDNMLKAVKQANNNSRKVIISAYE